MELKLIAYAKERAVLYFFLIFLVLYIVVALMGMSWAGWCLMGVFASLAIAFRGHHFLKGFTFTVTILAVVSLAMYYPQYFVTVGGFRLSGLIVPLLQVIMFGMGTELSLKDFAQVLRMPRGVIIGVICHYTIMPLVGFGLARMFGFPPEIAAGIILVGCCPSGLASNVMSFLARANLALSVSVTTVSTLLAPFLTPLMMRLLAGSFIEGALAGDGLGYNEDGYFSHYRRVGVPLFCSRPVQGTR
ncbi:bile acid:sodium symporter family protein [Puia sp. P3]|uniref:bile acid:sodium symporter family protein n=1 Tax=Puia sp. P3 TaxID=3423952 RepID=UPI003D67BBB0